MKRQFKIGNKTLEMEVRKNSKKEMLTGVIGFLILGVVVYYFSK